jgi:hypothetical protein
VDDESCLSVHYIRQKRIHQIDPCLNSGRATSLGKIAKNCEKKSRKNHEKNRQGRKQKNACNAKTRASQFLRHVFAGKKLVLRKYLVRGHNDLIG